MKPKRDDLKYTDLCIYIDNVFYERDENNKPIAFRKMTSTEQATAYEYMAQLIHMLAIKKRLFTKAEDYENFSYRTASIRYARMINPKIKFGLEDYPEGPGYRKDALPPIQSILNNIKSTLYFAAVDYRKEEYAEQISNLHESEEELQNMGEFLENQVRNDYERSYWDIMGEYLQYFHNFKEKVLNDSIYKKDNIMRRKIDLSLMLTLNNILTVSSEFTNTEKRQFKALREQLSNWQENIIAWDDTIDKPVVAVILKRIFKEISKSVGEEEDYYSLERDTVADILSSALPTYLADGEKMER